MNLRIVAIRESGVLTKERVVLRADSPTDTGHYILLRVLLQDGDPTTDVLGTFWFPDKPIKPGDLIVLYTKHGTPGEKSSGGGTAHFFYWGLSSPVWSENNVGATVLYAPEWITSAPNKE
ncbi:MAG: hypothetical protein IH621_03075 [Krumholzibacteria bacterium]|nr:hypothetical protein [Candidatus Krumholzibacteria bacterium]